MLVSLLLWNMNRKQFKSELTVDLQKDLASKPQQPVGPHRIVFHDVLQQKDEVCEGRPEGVRLQPAVTHDVKAAGVKGRVMKAAGVKGRVTTDQQQLRPDGIYSRDPPGKYPQVYSNVLCVFTYISGLHPSGFLFLWPMLMWYTTASDVSRLGYGSVPETDTFNQGCFTSNQTEVRRFINNRQHLS